MPFKTQLCLVMGFACITTGNLHSADTSLALAASFKQAASLIVLNNHIAPSPITALGQGFVQTPITVWRTSSYQMLVYY